MEDTKELVSAGGWRGERRREEPPWSAGCGAGLGNGVVGRGGLPGGCERGEQRGRKGETPPPS